jgi:hypothetical protein
MENMGWVLLKSNEKYLIKKSKLKPSPIFLKIF